MITVNGKELRNLEEQVQYNSDRIVAIIEGNEVLAEMGIKVVGQVSEATLLPDAATYTGDYGDAYLVGVTTPYEYYIYTRPFSGQTIPQWFLLGQFPVTGPQGPQGSVGPQGPKGDATKWHTGSSVPTFTAPEGDMYIRFTAINNPTNGATYVSRGNGEWQPIGVVRGPQGIQGPEGPQGVPGPAGESITGPQGPAGQFITIKGELENIDQLPDPESVGRESAYLIPIADVKHVFLIVGDETLSWVDAGSFGQGGTQVTVGGVYQQNFDADTKMNSDVSQFPYGSTQGLIAGYNTNTQKNVKWPLESGYTNYSIPIRLDGGRLNVGNPTEDYNATNKKYVVDNYTAKGSAVPIYDNTQSGLTRMYGCGPYAKGSGMYIASDRYANLGAALIMRNATTGSFFVPTPTEGEHPANKAYVDNLIVSTHKVNSSYSDREGAQSPVGIAIPSNVHCKLILDNPHKNVLANVQGYQMADVNGVDIPDFNQADVSYGDEGTFGYITISNKTYVFTVPAGGLRAYGYGGIYIIQHV